MRGGVRDKEQERTDPVCNGLEHPMIPTGVTDLRVTLPRCSTLHLLLSLSCHLKLHNVNSELDGATANRIALKWCWWKMGVPVISFLLCILL